MFVKVFKVPLSRCMPTPLSTPIHSLLYILYGSFFYISPTYATFKWRHSLSNNSNSNTITKPPRMSTIRWALCVCRQTSSRVLCVYVVFLFLLYSFCFPLPQQQTHIETTFDSTFIVELNFYSVPLLCFALLSFCFLCFVLRFKGASDQPCQPHARVATDLRN